MSPSDMKIGLFEAAATRRAVEAFDAYLTRQLELPDDRRDSVSALAARFRRLLEDEGVLV